MWQANKDLLSVLPFVIYICNDAPTKRKKVNIISSGDVNPGPVLSRQGLLEDSLCRVVGVARLSCD
jgi:hypothetical protein